MTWSSEPATESQVGRLRQFGYDTGCPLTKGEASYLIKVLEQQPETQAAAKDKAGQEIVQHVAYALRLSIEHARSAPVLGLYMKYGCRFVPPTHDQVQEVLDALDAASPVWDLDNTQLFYQTLELNFPELVRHA